MWIHFPKDKRNQIRLFSYYFLMKGKNVICLYQIPSSMLFPFPSDCSIEEAVISRFGSQYLSWLLRDLKGQYYFLCFALQTL